MQESIICCNKCGKIICLKEEVEKADYLKVEKNWGYFSDKDGICHKICICEECYDAWIKTFEIPPEEKENTELL